MSETANLWLAFAHEDLQTAEAIQHIALYNQVCFHAQQCVEKSLKGLLVYWNLQPPRTHSIADLLRLLPKSSFEDEAENLVAINRFYFSTRYPDALPAATPDFAASEEEAREAFDLARTVYQRVSKIIQSE